jgi:uncharacterized protein YlxW (UPF0749 family)
MSDDHRDTGTGWPEPPQAADPHDGASPPGPRSGASGATREDVDAEAPEPARAEAGADSDDAAPPLRPASTRSSGAGAIIGLLLVVLGFAIATQVRSTNTDDALDSARPEDLVRILSDLDAREERLRRELAELEESKRQLESGAQGREAALAEARRRSEVLGILAGTLPAEGPGLEVVFAPRDQRIRADSVLDAVEELRGAGAEALQISGATGEPVRIVAGTYFVDSGDGISVDGVPMSSPFTIEVIGDPATMQTALNIPGGVVDAVRQHGGNVTMRQPDLVRVTALHTGGPLKYARPVS